MVTRVVTLTSLYRPGVIHLRCNTIIDKSRLASTIVKIKQPCQYIADQGSSPLYDFRLLFRINANSEFLNHN